MTLVQKLQSFIGKDNSANWCLFVFFAGTLFVKCVLFNFLYTDSYIFSSLWRNPAGFWSWYLPIISISIAIASLVFLFRRKAWTIYFLIILDLWMIANLWYFRAYNMLLDAYAVTMVGNLNDGYWDAIQAMFRWKDMTLLICTALFYCLYRILKNEHRKLLYTPILLVIAILLHAEATHLLKKQDKWPPAVFNCFHYADNALLATTEYEYRYSIIHSAIFNINHLIRMCFDSNEHIEFTELEQQQIVSFCQPRDTVCPDGNVLLVLVESLESWTIHPDIMPHTCHFVSQYPTLFAPKIKRQVVGGLSADAQLIANTGLLPTQHGAVSHLYAENLFPSIADMYDTLTLSIASTPLDDCWHQWAMNKAYHFDSAWSKSPKDSLLFKDVVQAIDSGFRYTQVFTISSHTPFKGSAAQSSLQLPNGLPELLSNYIKAINVTDAGLAVLLSAIETDSILQNTTIIITGDHTILADDMRAQYNKSCQDQNLPYDVIASNYVPLIVYSPKIKENIRIDEVCYQMDIYPTIMHLIGCEDYYWKGFGVNLLDSTARHNRPITEEQAYQLSDKLIRADYFRELQ